MRSRWVSSPTLNFDANCFSVIEVLAGGPSPKPSEVGEVDLTPIRGARILLVKDNELNREVVLGLLEDAHLQIDIAGDGAAAVQQVSKNNYDMVFMDMQMPIMDGIAATKAIRSNPRVASLPIIAMTANAMDRDRELCLAVGMNDHLGKPIDPPKLFSTLLHWIPARSVTTGVATTTLAGEPTRRSAPNANPPSRAECEEQGVSRPSAVRDKSVVSAEVTDTLLIPGIDTATALRCTGGKRKRYESLLLRFAESQAAVVSDIRNALAAKDSPTARRLVHSLKGAGANLGAVSLAEAAAKAESAIVSNSPVEPAPQFLATTLDSIIAAVRSTLPTEPAVASSAACMDSQALVPPRSRLKRLLASDDADASDFFPEIRPALAGILSSTELDSLSAHVGNFAYSNALKSLSSIASRLSIELE